MGWRKFKFIHVISFILFASAFVYHPSFGQKAKVKNASKLQEAEFYFTEGEKYFILEDYAKALVLFKKSLDTQGDNATVYFKIAQIYAAGHELNKAAANIEQALKLDSNNKYFYILAAEIYTENGNFNRAAETYESLISNIENTNQYLLELASIYLYSQKYDEAIKTYDKLEEIYGINEEITEQKQKIYLQLGNTEKALEEGEKLISATPGIEQYLLKQAEILLNAGRETEAREILESTLKKAPTHTRARLVLSELERKEGDIESAIGNLKIVFHSTSLTAEEKIQLLAEYRIIFNKEDLKNYGLELAQILVEVHPEVADSYTIYADLLQTIGENKKAKDAYLKSLELNQGNFAVWQNVLQLYLQENKLDSVLMLSEDALELFPNQGSLYYFNGLANFQKRNYQEAVYALEQGKKLSSANLALVSVFNSILGDAYNAQEDFSKSDRAYDAALDFDPENYSVLNNYSYYLALRKENLEKAEKMAAKVAKYNPDNATYLDTYAWVLYVRGKYREAKKVIEQAINTNTNITAVYYEHYGDILFQLGKKEDAVKQWQKAKELNSNSKLIDKKIADQKLYE